MESYLRMVRSCRTRIPCTAKSTSDLYDVHPRLSWVKGGIIVAQRTSMSANLNIREFRASA